MSLDYDELHAKHRELEKGASYYKSGYMES